MKRITQLDSLRFFAFLLVFVKHSFCYYGNLSFPDGLLGRLGTIGVDLFFVLSGYLICKSLLVAREQPLSLAMQNFYMRRLTRIFPLYYAVLTVLLLCNQLPTPLIFYSYTYNIFQCFHPVISNLDHLWTLCVQEQFYMIVPWIILTVRMPIMILFLLAMICAAPSVESWMYANYPHSIPQYLLPVSGQFLASGCLVAIIEAKSKAWFKSFSTIIFFFGLMLFSIFVLRLVITGDFSDLMQHFAFGMIIFGLANTKNEAIINTLSMQPLRYLGMISYGLYIYHNLCFGMTRYFVRHYIPNCPLPAEIALNTVLVVAISALSWHLFESKIAELRRRKPATPAPVQEPAVAVSASLS